MNCRISDLKYKNVINIIDGSLIGCVNDVEMDTCNAKIISIVIYRKFKYFGLLGRGKDIIVPWEDIKIIGEDAILVKYYFTEENKKQKLSKIIPGLFK